MKKNILNLILCASMVMAAGSKSEAVVLAFNKNPIVSKLTKISLASMGLGLAADCLNEHISRKYNCSGPIQSIFRYDKRGNIKQAIVILIGLIVLDGDQPIELSPLSNELASQVGLSYKQLKAYNSNVETELSMVLNASVTTLANMENPTEEDFVTVIRNVGSNLDPMALEAFMMVRDFNKQTLANTLTSQSQM